jgi:hypothetical protein
VLLLEPEVLLPLPLEPDVVLPPLEPAPEVALPPVEQPVLPPLPEVLVPKLPPPVVADGPKPVLGLELAGELLKPPYVVSWSPPMPNRSRPNDCHAQ